MPFVGSQLGLCGGRAFPIQAPEDHSFQCPRSSQSFWQVQLLDTPMQFVTAQEQRRTEDCLHNHRFQSADSIRLAYACSYHSIKESGIA